MICNTHIKQCKYVLTYLFDNIGNSWLPLLQHPTSPPVRKEYHQRFGRRWIYVVGDSGAITAGSRTVGDVHPSPPVRIWNRWWWIHQHRRLKTRTGGEDLFPIKKYFHIIILHHLYNGVKRCKNSLLMNKTGFMRVKEIDYHSLPAETNISLA